MTSLYCIVGGGIHMFREPVWLDEYLRPQIQNTLDQFFQDLDEGFRYDSTVETDNPRLLRPIYQPWSQ